MKLPPLNKIRLPRLSKSKSERQKTVGELSRSTEHVRSTKQSWMTVKSKTNNVGFDHEREARRRSRSGRLSNLKFSLGDISVTRPSLRMFYVLVPFIAVLVLILFITYVHNNKVYVINQVEILGNEEITDTQIISAIGDLRGQSMFSISGDDLSAKLTANFPYIKTVYVDKELPGKVKISVIERYPQFAYANLSGAYLVDEDNLVISVIGVQPQNGLFEHERLVLDGYGDIQADYVFAEYISDIEDDKELEDLNWEEVTDNEKRATLNRLRGNIRARINSTLEENRGLIVSAGFQDLPIASGYDALVFKVGDKFMKEINDYSTQIIDYLDSEAITLRDIVWTSRFTISVGVLAKTEILFTATRPLEDQIKAFEALREANKVRNVRVIDLRSEIVSVR